jgi:hypothetical protein
MLRSLTRTFGTSITTTTTRWTGKRSLPHRHHSSICRHHIGHQSNQHNQSISQVANISARQSHQLRQVIGTVPTPLSAHRSHLSTWSMSTEPRKQEKSVAFEGEGRQRDILSKNSAKDSSYQQSYHHEIQSGTARKNNSDSGVDQLLKEKNRNQPSSNWSTSASASDVGGAESNKWPGTHEGMTKGPKEATTTAASLSELGDKLRNVSQKVESKLTGKASGTTNTQGIEDKPTTSSINTSPATYTASISQSRQGDQKSGAIGEEAIKTSGAHRSIWQRTVPTAPSFPPLERSIMKEAACDTVIIGAGISGLTTAYEVLCCSSRFA